MLYKNEINYPALKKSALTLGLPQDCHMEGRAVSPGSDVLNAVMDAAEAELDKVGA